MKREPPYPVDKNFYVCGLHFDENKFEKNMMSEILRESKRKFKIKWRSKKFRYLLFDHLYVFLIMKLHHLQSFMTIAFIFDKILDFAPFCPNKGIMTSL